MPIETASSKADQSRSLLDAIWIVIPNLKRIFLGKVKGLRMPLLMALRSSPFSPRGVLDLATSQKALVSPHHLQG